MTGPSAAIREARELAQGAPDQCSLTKLRLLAEREKSSPELWKLLGQSLIAAEEHAEAIAALMQSTWIVAKDADVWVSMAICAHRLGRQADATTYWKNAANAQPGLFRQRPALATLWRECRGGEERYDAIVRRLAKRADGRAALELLELVLTPDDVPTALASIQRIGATTPPVALAAFILCGASPERQLIAPLAADIGVDLTAALSHLDDRVLSDCLDRAVGIAGEGKDVVLQRFAACGDRMLARRIYAMADRGSIVELTALSALVHALLLS